MQHILELDSCYYSLGHLNCALGLALLQEAFDENKARYCAIVRAGPRHMALCMHINYPHSV